MPYGLTPYQQWRYPLIGNTVDPVDIQNLATDMNGTFTTLSATRTTASHRSSAKLLSAVTSVVKNTITTLSFPTVRYDNGASGPGAAAYYSAGQPTRLTAPTAGLYLVNTFIGTNWGGNINVANWAQIIIGRSGALVQPGIQLDKLGMAAQDSPTWHSTQQLWVMTAGQYLECRVIWNGNPAGPLSIQAAFEMTMIAIP